MRDNRPGVHIWGTFVITVHIHISCCHYSTFQKLIDAITNSKHKIRGAFKTNFRLKLGFCPNWLDPPLLLESWDFYCEFTRQKGVKYAIKMGFVYNRKMALDSSQN